MEGSRSRGAVAAVAVVACGTAAWRTVALATLPPPSPPAKTTKTQLKLKTEPVTSRTILPHKPRAPRSSASAAVEAPVSPAASLLSHSTAHSTARPRARSIPRSASAGPSRRASNHSATTTATAAPIGIGTHTSPGPGGVGSVSSRAHVRPGRDSTRARAGGVWVAAAVEARGAARREAADALPTGTLVLDPTSGRPSAAVCHLGPLYERDTSHRGKKRKLCVGCVCIYVTIESCVSLCLYVHLRQHCREKSHLHVSRSF